MKTQSNSELKANLIRKIKADANEAGARIARGGDPVTEGREHLARTGELYRQLKKIEKMENSG